LASMLQEALLTHLSVLNLDVKGQQELSTDVRFLLTSQRVSRFITFYKLHWHAHCPMLHLPTFQAENAQLTLIAAMVIMGAMYSADDRESHAAKQLLDLVELYVFASDVFSTEAEMRAAISGSHTPMDAYSRWINFQHFQGAYLMVVVQHWAGNRAARGRAMEYRFSQIIRVCRCLHRYNALWLTRFRLQGELACSRHATPRRIVRTRFHGSSRKAEYGR